MNPLTAGCVSPDFRFEVDLDSLEGPVVCDEWHARRLGLRLGGNNVLIVEPDALEDLEGHLSVSVVTTLPEQVLAVIARMRSHHLTMAPITVVTDSESFEAILETVLRASGLMLTGVRKVGHSEWGLHLSQPTADAAPASVVAEAIRLGSKLGGRLYDRYRDKEVSDLRQKAVSLIDLLGDLENALASERNQEVAAQSKLERAHADLAAARSAQTELQARYSALANSRLGKVTHWYWRSRRRFRR